MSDGYLAFLDVLGFGSLITGESGELKLNNYLAMMRSVIEDFKIDAVVFSDSIVFTVEDRKLDNLLLMLQSCAGLMHRFLNDRIAVRGAISCGHFVRQNVGSKGVFVAGRALVDAHYYEQQQDWVGVMLTPTLVGANGTHHLDELCAPVEFSDDELRKQANKFEWLSCLSKADIPFKDGAAFSGFAVVPGAQKTDPESIVKSLLGICATLRELRNAAPDPVAQAKYAATLGFLEPILRYWIAADGRKKQPGP